MNMIIDKDILDSVQELEQQLEFYFNLYPYSCLEVDQSVDKSKVNHNHVTQDKHSLSHDITKHKTKKRI